MLNKILKALKELPPNDKWLLGVSLVLLLNYQIAFVVALVVVGYFTYKILKPILGE